MTSRPRPIPLDRSLLPGLAAVGLFAILAAVFLRAETGALVEEWGFGEGANIIGSIGAALIGVAPGVPAESFVVALIVIALALDAALDGSIMLARREEAEADTGSTAVTDGGHDDPVADAGDSADADGGQGGER